MHGYLIAKPSSLTHFPKHKSRVTVAVISLSLWSCPMVQQPSFLPIWYPIQPQVMVSDFMNTKLRTLEQQNIHSDIRGSDKILGPNLLLL
jgi:hypothetical protein